MPSYEGVGNGNGFYKYLTFTEKKCTEQIHQISIRVLGLPPHVCVMIVCRILYRGRPIMLGTKQLQISKKKVIQILTIFNIEGLY